MIERLHMRHWREALIAVGVALAFVVPQLVKPEWNARTELWVDVLVIVASIYSVAHAMIGGRIDVDTETRMVKVYARTLWLVPRHVCTLPADEIDRVAVSSRLVRRKGRDRLVTWLDVVTKSEQRFRAPGEGTVVVAQQIEQFIRKADRIPSTATDPD